MALENSNPTENEKLYIEDDEKEQEAHPLNTADSLILENLDVPEETRSEREPGRGGVLDWTGGPIVPPEKDEQQGGEAKKSEPGIVSSIKSGPTYIKAAKMYSNFVGKIKGSSPVQEGDVQDKVNTPVVENPKAPDTDIEWIPTAVPNDVLEKAEREERLVSRDKLKRPVKDLPPVEGAVPEKEPEEFVHNLSRERKLKNPDEIEPRIVEKPRASVEKVEKKLSLEEKKNEDERNKLSPEKSYLGKKLESLSTNKKVKIAIAAGLVGLTIAIPVGGVIAGCYGMGLAQAVLGHGFIYGAAAETIHGAASVALGTLGATWALPKILKEWRDAGKSNSATLEPLASESRPLTPAEMQGVLRESPKPVGTETPKTVESQEKTMEEIMKEMEARLASLEEKVAKLEVGDVKEKKGQTDIEDADSSFARYGDIERYKGYIEGLGDEAFMEEIKKSSEQTDVLDKELINHIRDIDNRIRRAKKGRPVFKGDTTEKTLKFFKDLTDQDWTEAFKIEDFLNSRKLKDKV